MIFDINISFYFWIIIYCIAISRIQYIPTTHLHNSDSESHQTWEISVSLQISQMCQIIYLPSARGYCVCIQRTYLVYLLNIYQSSLVPNNTSRVPSDGYYGPRSFVSGHIKSSLPGPTHWRTNVAFLSMPNVNTRSTQKATDITRDTRIWQIFWYNVVQDLI